MIATKIFTTLVVVLFIQATNGQEKEARRAVKVRAVKSASEDIEKLLEEGFAISEKNRLKEERLRGGYNNTKHVYGSVKRPKSSTELRTSCVGSIILETSKLIAQKEKLSKKNAVNTLKSIDIPEELLKKLNDKCRKSRYGDGALPELPEIEPDCLEDEFRTASGVCNNPKELRWGSILEPQQRMLPADFADGVSIPRGLGSLPNPRLVSLTLMDRPTPPKSEKVTQMLKVWGQFLDHDIIKTPEVTAGVDRQGEIIDLPCCEEGKLEESTPAECMPITIPEADSFFRGFGVECLRFVRALPFSGSKKFSPREQLNEVTSFIDASTVYGSSIEEQKELRELKDGLLRVGQGKESFCPRACPLQYLVESSEPEGDSHFLAGDGRVNEQPSLAAMHTIWLRMHNLIAQKVLSRFNGDDERTFQEARKYVGAMVQHITYTEFLPVVLGPQFMEDNGLATPSPQNQDNRGYDTRYDVSLNPGVINVFGAAALRFGHTLITGDMAGRSPFPLAENFNNGKLLRGLTTHPSDILENEFQSNAEGVDSLLHPVLTTQLLAEAPFEHGSDLMSLNIMRGRDHGIPGYNAWRRVCGLRRFRNFRRMRQELNRADVDKFSRLYDNVNDVDLFPAALAEEPTADGILGPTFSCIFAEQFKSLKFGDRFWYENGPSVHENRRASLTPGELRAIRRISLAHVLCLTTSIHVVSKFPMKALGDDNPWLDCQDLVRENAVRRFVGRIR